MRVRWGISLETKRRTTFAFVFLIAFAPVFPVFASTEASEEKSAIEAPAQTKVEESEKEPEREPPEPSELPDEPDTDTEKTDEEPQSAALAVSTTPPAPLPTLQTPSTVKTHRPEIDESSGALQYAFPFTIPPGRNGLQPDLQLTYNSQDREDGSAVGFSWSLSIPSITRINKTGSQQMYNLPHFASSLDGELSTVSGAFYYAKVDRGTLREYQPIGDVWTMRDNVGTLYTFGGTVASRQDNPNDSTQVYRWMISEIRDRNDNFISFTYDKINGQIYPSTITYTGHGTTSGIFEISFVRELRPDIRKNYRSAFLVQTGERISQVIVRVNSAVVRTYDLGYIAGQDGTRSMLASITESGVDEIGNTVTLPPTTFTYASQTSRTSTTPSTWAAPFHITTPGSGVLVADANGDGLPDLLKSTQDYWGNIVRETHLNTGNGWAASSTWLTPSSLPFAGYNGNPDFGVQAIDVNADGRADLVKNNGYLSGSFEVWLNNGSGWALNTPYSNYSYIFDQDPYQIDQGSRLVDINGDDLPDWIKENGPNAYVQLNTGSGWASVQNNPTQFNPPFPTLVSTGATFADVNADGLVDIMYGAGFMASSTYLNTGTGWVLDSGFASPANFNNSGNGDNGVRPVDLDNNGLVDIGYRRPYIDLGWLNTGTGFVGPLSNWNPGGSCDFANGADQNATRFADLNGDGLSDWFCTAGPSNPPTTYAIINTGSWNDTLTSINTSLGATTTVSYQATPFYLDASSARLNPMLPYVMHTVHVLTHNDGFGLISSETFSYEGGSYYYGGVLDRKFAGFHSITNTDAVGNTTTTWFHQGNGTDASLGESSDHMAKIGLPFRVEVEDVAGNLLRVVVNTWGRTDLAVCANFVRLDQTVSLDYDGNSTHRDRAVSYTYDPSSTNVLQMTEWGEVNATSSGSFTDSGSDKRTTNYLYAYNGPYHILGLQKQATVTDQSGTMIVDTKSYYDNLPFGSVDIGNLTKEERWKTGTSYIDIERSYNSFGFMTQELDPLNHATSYTPDAYNLYPATVTNALGHATSYLYDYSLGKPTQTTDPSGGILQTVYDGLDRVIEEKQSNPSTASVLETKTTYGYVSQTIGMRTQKTDYLDALLSKDTYTYTDGFDRPIQTRIEAESTNTYSVSDTIYDAREYVWKQSLPYFSSGVGRTSATTTPALLSTFTYDALGRAANLSTVVGNTSTAYDQWISTVTDPRGKVKTFTKDAYDRLVTVVENNASSSYTTAYTYNGRGDLTQITDALGNVRAFTYDGLSRRLTAQDLHAPTDTTFGTWTYVYNDAGNIITTTKPDGTLISRTYDALNRLATENITATTGTDLTQTYDTCTNGIGRLCQAVSSSDTETWSYDELGRATTETDYIDSSLYTTSYAYNRQGKETLITYPDGMQVQYTYNSAGDLESVSRKEWNASVFSPVVVSIDRAPTGKVTVTAFANNTTTTNTYDANELYRMRTKITSTPSGNQQHLTYTYDQNSNVSQVVDASSTLSAKTTTYTYDDLNRLLSATVTGAANGNNGTQTYTYNALGNILTRSDVGNYAYTGNTGSNYANPHAATSAGITALTYNQQGNVLQATGPSSTPWYSPNWLGRSQFTIQESQISGTTALNNFVVLLSTTQLTLRHTSSGGSVAQTNGNDILFTAADGVTKLDHQIEKYNPATGQLVAWVRIPSLSATVNTPILIYYGNATCASQQNTSGVWGGEYEGVWHMHTGPAGGVLDSSSNAYTGTAYGSMPVTALQSAKIGNGIAFDGVDDYLNTGIASAVTSMTGDFTFSTWVRPTSLTGTRRFLAPARTITNNGWAVGSFAGSTTTNARLSNFGGNEYNSTSSLALNTWRRIDVVKQSGMLYFYRNGALTTTTTGTSVSANTDDSLLIGATTLVGSSTKTEFFRGSLDEVRVQSVVRPSTWIQAEYNNQQSPNVFAPFGAVPGSGNTYVWDYRDRLTAISGLTVGSFGYDHNNVRVKAALGTSNTRIPNRYYSMEGTTPTKHIFAEDVVVATVYNSALAATILTVHTDHLTGSAVLTNTSGVQDQLLDYHPWGTIRINNQSTTFNEKRKFAGHEYDAETGLSYMLARYYSPTLGRFFSEDPAFLDLGDADRFKTKYQRTLEQHLQNPQVLNSYAYGLNNPVTYRDPQGEVVPVVVAIGAVLAVAVEVGLTAFDIYTTIQTLRDPHATGAEKATVAVGLAAGVGSPMGGYSYLGRQALQHTDEAASITKNLLEAAPRGAHHPFVKYTLQYGRAQHAAYHLGDVSDTFIKEFRLGNGMIVDAIDFKTRTIYELKPNNSRAIHRGQQQLERYIKQAEEQFGGKFTGKLETYDRK